MTTDDPAPAGTYLGCNHIITEEHLLYGSNPSHGSIPFPPPQPAKNKTPEVDKAVATITDKSKHKKKKPNDDHIANNPGKRVVKVRLMT